MAWTWSPDAGQWQDTETGQLSPTNPAPAPAEPPPSAPAALSQFRQLTPAQTTLFRNASGAGVLATPPDPGSMTEKTFGGVPYLQGPQGTYVNTPQGVFPLSFLGSLPLPDGSSTFQSLSANPQKLATFGPEVQAAIPREETLYPVNLDAGVLRSLGFPVSSGRSADVPRGVIAQGPEAVKNFINQNVLDVVQDRPHGGIGDVLGKVFGGVGGAAGILSFLQPELAPFLAPVAIASGLGSGSLAASQGNPLGAVLGFGGAALGGLNLAGSAGGGVGQIGQTGFEPGLGQAQAFDLGTPVATAGATGGIGAGGGGGAGHIGQVGFEPGLTTGPIFGTPLTDVGQIGQVGFEPGLDAARRFDLGGLPLVGAPPSGETPQGRTQPSGGPASSAGGTDWLSTLLKALGLGTSLGGQQGAPAMSLNLGFSGLGGNLGTPEETPALPNVDLMTTYPLRGLANVAAPDPFTLTDPLAGMENWMMLSSLGAGPMAPGF